MTEQLVSESAKSTAEWMLTALPWTAADAIAAQTPAPGQLPDRELSDLDDL